MKVKPFFHSSTKTFTYVVFDEHSKDALVIDSVLDYDENSGKISHDALQEVTAYIKKNKLLVSYVLDTHVHADHLSGMDHLKISLDAKTAISKKICETQTAFSKIFNLGSFECDGGQFDILLEDGQCLKAGALTLKAIATPGHTPCCMTFDINGSLFTGDALLLPALGCGRCDFPNGSAEALFDSIQKIYQYPYETPIYVGHDYPAPGAKPICETTVGAQRDKNIMIKSGEEKNNFVDKRNAKDQKLAFPKLLYPSLQININAGQLPRKEDNNTAYLKIPLS